MQVGEWILRYDGWNIFTMTAAGGLVEMEAALLGVSDKTAVGAPAGGVMSN